MDGRTDEVMGGLMNEQVDEWMDGMTERGIDEWIIQGSLISPLFLVTSVQCHTVTYKAIYCLKFVCILLKVEAHVQTHACMQIMLTLTSCLQEG